MPSPRRRAKEPLPPRIKRVSEYLSDVVSMLDSKPMVEALDLADPFADALVEAAKGSFAWVRFATKVYDNLKGRDPEALVAALCHSAYIASVAVHLRPLAVGDGNPPARKRPSRISIFPRSRLKGPRRTRL